MNLSDSIERLIRTWVPVVIGAVVAQIPALADAFNAEVLVAACIGGWYVIGAFLENKVHPAFGWLLGMPKS